MTENHQHEDRANAWTDYAAQQTGSTQAPAPSRSGRRKVIIGAAALLAIGGVAGGTALANAGTVAHSAAVGYQAGPAVDPSGTAAAEGSTDSESTAPAGGTEAAPTPGDTEASKPTPQPHLDGTVTGTADGAITIKDHEGFTRVINVSSSTEYTDDLTATPAGGTEIHAIGTVNADGISLDATEVGARPTPPAGGPGADGKGPGGKGPSADGKGPGADGTGPDADAPKPPTGTDAPAPPSGAPAAPSTESSAPTTTG